MAHYEEKLRNCVDGSTRWFKYDRDYLCVNKSQFVPVIFEPPYIIFYVYVLDKRFNIIKTQCNYCNETDRYVRLKRTTSYLDI
jgi:hypothetical protein